MIGIIGAMDKEIDDLKNVMKDVSEEKISGMTFYKGALSGKDVVLVRSGIGKVNAAMCTEALIIKYNVECVINTGIAGSLNSKIDIGDIVLSTDSLEHDIVELLGRMFTIPEVIRIMGEDNEIIVSEEQVRSVLKRRLHEVERKREEFRNKVADVRLYNKRRK